MSRERENLINFLDKSDVMIEPGKEDTTVEQVLGVALGKIAQDSGLSPRRSCWSWTSSRSTDVTLHLEPIPAQKRRCSSR
jgi:hypothetical protein